MGRPLGVPGWWLCLLLWASLGASARLWARPCADCGSELTESSRFCPTCGKQVRPQKACAECGKNSPAEARFCGHCGQKFAYAPEDEERQVALAVKSRGSYLDELRRLVALYRELGLPERAELVEEEIQLVSRAVRVVPRERLADGASEGPSAPPVFQSIEEADRLWAEAEELRKSPNLFRRKEYLRKALELYQKVLLKHPASDKVDECAFRVGEIYGSPFFGNFERALEYYQMCWKLNPKTDFDARFRAAEIAELRLGETGRAIELYRLAAAEDPVPENREAAAKRLKKLQPQPKETPE